MMNLMNYDELNELWTMNYELLWTRKLWYEVLWGIQSVVSYVCMSWTCVVNDENKEL